MNYYFEDLSLSEIALDTNTSKAAVFDLIKRTSKTLENYEVEELLKPIQTLPREDETYIYPHFENSNAQKQLFEESSFEIKNNTENFNNIEELIAF